MQIGSFGLEAFEQLTNMIVVVVVLETISVSYFTRPKVIVAFIFWSSFFSRCLNMKFCRPTGESGE